MSNLNFYKIVSKINALKQGKVFFVEIGAMDGVKYDSLHPYIKENNWTGVLVEPTQDMFLKLKENYKDKNNLFFENSAISNQCGTDYIYKYSNEKISNLSLPQWLEGCSTMNPNNHTEVNQDDMIKESINLISFKNLMDKYNITHIDILQVDTEGHDYIVFNQVMQNISPIFIKIEIQHISYGMLKKMEELLWEKNYSFEIQTWDLIAVHNYFKNMLIE